MRFVLDERLSPRIAAIARGLGLDVISCVEAGRRGLNDEEQLRLAALDGRCMVTQDHDDLDALSCYSHSPKGNQARR